MNLSDHSESIHKSIQLLKEGVRKLQVDDGWNWLNNLLNGWGLSGWLLSIVKTGLVILIIVVVVLLMMPCLVSLLQRALQWTVSAIFVAQIQKGGIVGNCGRSADSLTEEGVDLDQIVVNPRKKKSKQLAGIERIHEPLDKELGRDRD